MSVPWILHQTYKSHDLRKDWIEYRNTWHEFGDSWDYRFYVDEDLRDHISKYFPQYVSTYDSFKHFIERVDFARYALLHTFGGIYADLDMKKTKSFGPLMKNNKAVVGTEPIEHANSKFKRNIVFSNALMLSNAKNPYWLSLMDFIVRNYGVSIKGKNLHGPIANTGPLAMTLHWEDACHNKGGFATLPDGSQFLMSDHLTIYPSCVFFSETWNNHLSKSCDGTEAYAIHKWTTSWIGSSQLVAFAKWTQDNWLWIVVAVLVVIIIIFAIILAVMVSNFYKKKTVILKSK